MHGTITLQFVGPQEYLDRAILAFAAEHGWTPTVPDAEGLEIPNPQTAIEAARAALEQYIKSVASRRWERQQLEQLKGDIAAAASTITLTVEG